MLVPEAFLNGRRSPLPPPHIHTHTRDAIVMLTGAGGATLLNNNKATFLKILGGGGGPKLGPF